MVIAGTPFGMIAFDMETANPFGAPYITVIGNNSALRRAPGARRCTSTLSFGVQGAWYAANGFPLSRE